MDMNKSPNKNISRRDFLKKSGEAALALSGGLALESVLGGCAPALKETRQDVGRIEWECNPIIPITDKIYTGTNLQVPIDHLLEWCEKNFGIGLTFHHPCIYGSIDGTHDMFPKEECETHIRHGVIPVVRYIVFSKPLDIFRPIIKGECDDFIKKFAHQTAKFEHPIILLPFEQPNTTTRAHKLWSGYPGRHYVDAWVRMHELFEREGANKNTGWTTKLKFGHWPRFSFPDPFQYIPPKQYVDTIGWQANNQNKPNFGMYSQSLRQMFGSYYNKAAKKYPTKPQMFWEFSSNAEGGRQDSWLDKSLTDIETVFLRVKGVMLDEINWRHPTMPQWGSYIASLTPESVKVIRKHFTSPYYIGSIIKK